MEGKKSKNVFDCPQLLYIAGRRLTLFALRGYSTVPCNAARRDRGTAVALLVNLRISALGGRFLNRVTTECQPLHSWNPTKGLQYVDVVIVYQDLGSVHIASILRLVRILEHLQ